MPFSHSILTPREKELMRRSNAARRLIKAGLDPELALHWVTAPQQELEQRRQDIQADRPRIQPRRRTA